MNSLMKVRLIFAIMLVLCQAACDRRPDIANLNSQGETIICFGDSITEGNGVKPEESYPSLLSAKLGRPVINAGVSGDTTADALRRLEKDVLNKNPKLVIIEFGGNDFLRNVPKETTLANLETLVVRIQEHGAMVIIASVKTGWMTDTYYQGFQKIADQRKALLVSDIMKGIFNNPKLKSDGLHPNAEGYRIIADRIYQAVKGLLI